MYGIDYEGCEDLGNQNLCSDLSLEDAFDLAAQESADAFLSNGGTIMSVQI